MPAPLAIRRARSRVLAVVALALALGACSAGGSGPPITIATPARASAAAPTPASASPCPVASTSVADLGRLARQGPDSGTWVGLNIDWSAETVADVTRRLGSPPAVVVSFVSFPLTPTDVANLDGAAGQARDAGAVLVATLEPWGGLSTVTEGAAADIASRLAGYGADGVPTIVRFAHEMNGSWYPWGQDPAAYVEAFRRLAAAVHAGAPTAAMLWAPNQGSGYPYAGGRYVAPPGSQAAKALDTNGDGRLDAGDDPYAPYWPGADSVDWVGMSLYYWGTSYPWGANTVPPAGTFARLLTGGAPADQDRTPDFYAGYAERYARPLAIVESAAFWRPDGGGAAESEIKAAWLAEVFSAASQARFPLLRMVNWFEWRKHESEVNAVVDWRITADPELRARFLAAMANGFRLGPAITPTTSGQECSGR